MLRRIRDLFSDVARQADLVLLALCSATSLFGILMIYSATRYMHTSRLVLVQAASLVIGVVLYLLMSQIDLNELVKYWKWIFLLGFGFVLLLATPLGIEGGTGNRAWLEFPFLPVKVQPAEIVKVTFIIVLAKQLAWLKEHRDLKSVGSMVMLALHFGVLFLTYYKISADMGSALVFLFIFACMCFVAGVALWWFIIGGGAAALLFYAMWDLNLMNTYMKKRFIILFDHSYDPLDTGWQQTRSLLALGGGSAIDAAKGMWLFYENPETSFDGLRLKFMDIRKRIYTFPKMGEKAYFIAVPTSAGTGSEATPFAVITDETTGVKYPLADYELLPKMAIVDANMMMNAPKGLTSASGIDAVTHALEAIASMMATDYTDSLAERALKIIFETHPQLTSN